MPDCALLKQHVNVPRRLILRQVQQVSIAPLEATLGVPEVTDPGVDKVTPACVADRELIVLVEHGQPDDKHFKLVALDPAQHQAVDFGGPPKAFLSGWGQQKHEPHEF